MTPAQEHPDRLAAVAGDILIVDDQPDNLTVLGEMLQDAGYRVRPALSGRIALRAVAAVAPDLILLDIRMPDMDGHETCRRLKAVPEYRAIPVIFISALHDITDKVQAFQSGAVDYITKPFQGDEVLARVQTQIGLSQARQELAENNVRLSMLMEQLVQAEKLKSLGSLAAGVAHELNTPIGNALLAADSISTLAQEMAAASPAGTRSAEMGALLQTCLDGSDLVLRNLQRASRLVRSLKEVSIDGSSDRRRQISLLATINDVVTLLGGMLRQASCVVHIAVAPDLLLETCPGYLEQILCNLIENAVVHGFEDAGHGTIGLSARRFDHGVLIEVSDDGRGIPPEDLKRIFDPFFTTRLGRGGSGLGLHIAHNLAGALGGSLQASSRPGEGTRFCLSLPWMVPEPAGNPSHSNG